MKTIKFYCFILLFFQLNILQGQSVEIIGTVIANEDVEGVHIINKTAGKFTITDAQGAFMIPVRFNDTLVVSGVKYQPKTLTISKLVIENKMLIVYLTEQITALDEVIVGKVLTGDLLSDIESSDAKRDINFYDLGIPGYTGKRKTQNERRLYEADHGKYIQYYGLGLAINTNKILNAITGRTKRLKSIVKFETQNKCMKSAIAEFADILFETDGLEDNLKAKFFYFASEDSRFLGLCKIDDELRMFEFLQQKLKTYRTKLSAAYEN